MGGRVEPITQAEFETYTAFGIHAIYQRNELMRVYDPPNYRAFRELRALNILT